MTRVKDTFHACQDLKLKKLLIFEYVKILIFQKKGKIQIKSKKKIKKKKQITSHVTKV